MHGFVLWVTSHGLQMNARRMARTERWIRRCAGICHRGRHRFFGQSHAEKAGARRRAQRGRQQHGLPAGFEVCLEQLLQQHRHVSVGGMHFVDHQQAARQQRMPHVGMAYLERTKQSLVYRTDSDGGSQKPLGRFGHPTLVRFFVGGIVGPLDLEVGQADFFLFVCRLVTG